MASSQSRLKFRSTKKASVVLNKESYHTILKHDVSEESKENANNFPNTCALPESRISRKRYKMPEDGDRGNVSPPKQDKLSDDDKSKSPSQCFANLHIDEESSKDCIASKRLFDKGTYFRKAQQALHSYVPRKLPGREAEIQELETFLLEKLNTSTSGSLYISGPPGTGKTACLTSLLQTEKFQDYRSVYVNCTSMKSSGCIYSRICEELKLKISKKGEKQYLQTLNKFWESNRKMTILILDEIDQLESKRQCVLYTVFEWPSKPESRVILIGIANALDLTDRTLPRLQAHVKLKPKLLHFTPYTKEQIVSILTERLREMDVLDVFSPLALQLLAGKVASVSGDVRRALDIGRRVLELAETQKISRVAPLQPSTHSVSNASSPIKKADNGPVELNIVSDVLNSVYGTSQSLSKSSETYADDSFPLQQKLLVCTFLLLLKKGKIKDVSIGKLHEIYCRVCKKRGLVAVSLTEFLNVCQLVETKGILQVQKKKEVRLAKIRLLWDEEEVAAALCDKHLLATVLSDIAVL